MFSTLRCMTTVQSLPRLNAKIKGLFRSRSERQFTENLVELEVAWALTDRVSPLVFEPLVSETEFAEASKRPKSPDFAFYVPENKVYLEVTVCYVDVLEKWQQATDYIMTTLEKRLLKKGRVLNLRLQLPLRKYSQEQAARMTNRAWQEICSFPSGQLTLIDQGTLQWSPYSISPLQDGMSSPHMSSTSMSHPFHPTGSWDILVRAKQISESPSSFLEISPSGVFHSPDWLVDQAILKETRLVALSEEDQHSGNELILTAFLNKLKQKREQAPRGKPYLLAIKPGHYRLVNNGLVAMFEQHIWPKKDYDWITGIIFYTSRQGFRLTDKSGQLTIMLNPQARCPASEALVSMIDGKAQFHIQETGW